MSFFFFISSELMNIVSVIAVGIGDARIQDLLDENGAKIVTGVFVAPILRGDWGTSAQVQIEPKTIYGPHECVAKGLVRIRFKSCGLSISPSGWKDFSCPSKWLVHSNRWRTKTTTEGT